MMKLEWNVLYYDFNARKIITFNVFDHGRFREEVIKLFSPTISRNEFSKKLRSIVMYSFCCKAEYEVIISPWIGDEKAAVKIDIYTQLMNNWEQFVNYTGNELLKLYS
uniref:hypothetical protein n=1 Tax=Coprococcus catus TaxID=116085 RepID=UPI0022E4E5D1|nr:hypothetical protein [Coprococcus catus]